VEKRENRLEQCIEVEENRFYLENSIIEAQQLTLLLWAEDALMYFFYIFLVFCHK